MFSLHKSPQAAVLLFLLTGCGGGGSTTTSPTQSNPQATELSTTTSNVAITTEVSIQTPLVVKKEDAVLKTGQNVSYGPYDDGYYQMGKTKTLSRNHTEEIVIDTHKNLMWQDNIEVKTNAKPWLTKEAYGANRPNDTTGDTATNYCKALRLGDYKDWRLPTIGELQSITKDDTVNPALNFGVFANYTTKFGYWTSTTLPGDLYDAWIVEFMCGGTNSMSKEQTNGYIRCVRSI
jgi:hypothetical protein